MFVSCACLFSLPLVPVPADVPSGTSRSKRGMCREALHRRKSRLSRATSLTIVWFKSSSPPPPHPAQIARFFVKRQRRASPHVVPLLYQDIYSLNIKTIYTRNIWILMLYSAFHMLGMNVDNSGNAKCFNLCLKLCSIYIIRVPNVMSRFTETVMIILNQWDNRLGDKYKWVNMW